VSIRETRSHGPAGELAARPVADSRSRNLAGEALAIVGVIVLAGLIEFSLRGMLTRPFYSDESWRAYDISIGTGFLAHLSTSGAPLALGWVAIENAARVLFGDTQAGLRVPMFLGLPALGVATYLLARRWLGICVSFCTAALLVVNSWTVNNALQLKSYSYEGLLAIAAVAVYLLIQRSTWHRPKLLLLYATLGLTCVFSVPNLLIVGPLLVMDLIQAIRARDRTALRIGGEAIAGGIALAHYVLFVRPQSAVAGTRFWLKAYAPHQLGPFIHFTISGVQSFFPGMITGVVGVTNAAPAYRLPFPAHDLLAIVVAVLLCAGIVAAAVEQAGRVLVVAVGAAFVLELAGSTVQRWPFGMVRVNIFMLPLLYVLVAIGAVRLADLVRGRRAANGTTAGPVSWWRALVLAGAAIVLAMAGLTGGVATAHALAETSRAQSKPVDFSELKAAVARARMLAAPSDLAIIRADYYSPPIWYGEEWLYFMRYYRGYPAAIAARPEIPASNTLSVFYVTPAALHRFLAAHPASPAIFLFEFFMPWGAPSAPLHQQSLRTLREFGYCPTRQITYQVTGQLTMLIRGGCAKSG
jgi:hypothetical protein